MKITKDMNKINFSEGPYSLKISQEILKTLKGRKNLILIYRRKINNFEISLSRPTLPATPLVGTQPSRWRFMSTGVVWVTGIWDQRDYLKMLEY